MLVSEFDYMLPARLIAQEPAGRRDRSRLLVMDRSSGELADSTFDRLPDWHAAGDLLVINNTRVFPARLFGRKVRTEAGARTPGARVEVFLVREIEPLLWETLVRPGRALRPGARVEFAEAVGDTASSPQGRQRVKLTGVVSEWLGAGRRIVRFECDGDFDSIVDSIGRTPLPPYIKGDRDDRLDSESYQTVYASRRGAVAAPTAGLHFTPELLERVRRRGVEIAEITLHVGYGTFQPVRVERVEDHRVELETYSIESGAAGQINAALNGGRRIIAVGTTTTRALESWALGGSKTEVRQRATDLFIYPGFRFNVIAGLITNFHLPRSSLLMLVSAFAGRENVLRAYRHAIEREYRFYSYGDAMLII